MTSDLHTEFPVSMEAARWIAEHDQNTIPRSAFAFAKHALLDCFGCMIAGQSEPLAEILLAEFAASENGECSLVARTERTSLHNAALINGAAAHALDFDDVHRRLHGHPTACVAPATLALGEKLGASGQDVLTAFIIGTEVACALGEMCEEGHYEAGFHATGTLGTFGAAAAAARLMGLDVNSTATALGIAASQAAGLKANFGTMTKPLHAGKAAMNGLIAARLAARGFTANQAAIEAPHGFAQAQVPDFEAAPIRYENTAPYAVEEMLYKFHASCFLTHSTLNAIRKLRIEHGLKLDDVEKASLKVRASHASVCCIPAPVSGLEIKFSIQHLAAMGLDGVDTSALGTYCDENANDPRFIAARGRIDLDLTDDIDRSGAVVSVELKDGRRLSAEDNVGIPAQNPTEQWDRLCDKFQALAVPVVGSKRVESIIGKIADLETAGDVSTLMNA